MSIACMTDVDLVHKKVLIREDLNVPMADGCITSDARIRAALPTLRYALDQQAAVIVISHMGRPEEGVNDPAFSLAPVATLLAEMLGQPVKFVTNWIGGVECAPGEIVLCENTRFLIGENANDVALAKKMAALCDVFVMDAFATAHRAQASTYGVASFAPVACAGLLFDTEVNALQNAMKNPTHPVLAIVGGSKVSTKLTVLRSLSTVVDQLIVGGGIANTFLAAAGFSVGKSLYEPDLIEEARALIALAKQKGCEIPIPVDVVVTTHLGPDAPATIKKVTQISSNDIIVDIGPQTIQQYTALIKTSKTIVWNGPVGVFEMQQFAKGTESVALAIAVQESAFSLAGGGDTVAAIEKFGIEDKISYISTAGGAFLEFLEGKILPGVDVLERRACEIL